MVGPPGFEPGSIAPEATSLDQTSRRPQIKSLYPYALRLSKANQRAILTRVKRLSKLVKYLQDYSNVEKAVYSLHVKNYYKNKLFAEFSKKDIPRVVIF